jgi:hypothetical protein
MSYKQINSAFFELNAMKSKQLRKKGQALGGLSNSAIAVLLLVLVVSVGATVLQTIRGTQTAGNHDYNITTAGLSSLNTYSDFFSVIVVVVVFAVIIGLFAFFTLRGRGSI